MTHMKATALCNEPWCRDEPLPGLFQCAKHYKSLDLEVFSDRTPPRGTERKLEYRSSCQNCGRGEYLTLSVAELAALKPQNCTYGVCGGRMRVDPDDNVKLGSSFDPRVPTKMTYRVARTS